MTESIASDEDRAPISFALQFQKYTKLDLFVMMPEGICTEQVLLEQIPI
jgi:hypothetical protein